VYKVDQDVARISACGYSHDGCTRSSGRFSTHTFEDVLMFIMVFSTPSINHIYTLDDILSPLTNVSMWCAMFV